MGNMSRREFVLEGSLVLCGAAAGAGVMGGDILSPQNARASGTVFPESECNPEAGTGKKILVAYTSFCGTTGGVAEAIGRGLCEHGAEVDVRLIKHVDDISPYDAFVIGSPVRGGSWWPDALDFVDRHREALSRVPVAYFLTCLALVDTSDGARRVARSYMDQVMEAAPGIRPVDMGFFAGVLDYSKLSFVYRMVMKSKMKKKGVPEGDFRDWEAIGSWAKGLCSPLLGEEPEAGGGMAMGTS